VDGIEYVEARDVRRSPFRVALTPLPSLTSALRDAVGAGRSGTPTAWCEAIRRHLRSADYETLAPFITPGTMLVPEPLMGLTNPSCESFADSAERIMATPTGFLAEEIAACSAASGNPAWREAERDPGRWLHRYVGAVLRAWSGFGPVWRHARPALDREMVRVALATARDAQLELLDGLLDHGSVQDGRWRVDCAFYEGRVRFPEDGLVLIPLVAGQRSSITSRSDDVVGSIAYPLRCALTLDPTEPPAATLEALLGIPRAQILRTVRSPTSVGTLAAALRAVPSAATHHVAALEAAGLVIRSRRGRNVLVRRTTRGEALLQLYDADGIGPFANRGDRI
jgi:DNA-binding transcriptional ArsR family regulator